MRTTDELLADPQTLHIERRFDVSPSVIWRCWAEPELLKRWYCPKPWRVSDAVLELREGGRFDVVMQGPGGEEMDIKGRYEAVEPGRRLVFGKDEERVSNDAPMDMTGFVDLAGDGEGGTRMIWGAAHPTAEDRATHERMGFEAGWNAAADQLADLAREVAAGPGNAHASLGKVSTCLWFDKDGEAAARFYTQLLPGSRMLSSFAPTDGEPVMVAFELAGVPYAILNAGPSHPQTPAASISVMTDDQAETDRLWDSLLDGGEAMSCGWLKDRWGVSWQIVPAEAIRLITGGDAPAKAAMDALMQMRRIDLATLRQAARNAG